MTTYIIATQANATQNVQMQNFLRTSPYIGEYWNYIPSIYCVKTELRSKELREKIDPFFPKGGFLIAELKATNIDGRLVPHAWTWFQDPSDLEAFRIRQEPFGSLAPKPRGLMNLGLPSKKKGGLLGGN